jgi:hypothetical protein
MSDETLYFYALEKLNSITCGSSDFQRICLTLIKFMHTDYDFKVPEGGEGTRDGGYDAYDPIKKAKLACSIDIDYKRKIKDEVKKSKKNSDLQIFYLSNQKISEPEKNRIKADPDNDGIDLIICGIGDLSRELENYFKVKNDPELYDLLGISSLKVGELYRRGDVFPFNIIFNGNMYKKQITIIDKNPISNLNAYAGVEISENPLLDFILKSLMEMKLASFRNIALCGIGYLGKSFIMKMTFDTLLREFSDKKNYIKYKYIPFIQFLELKYYSRGKVEAIVKNTIDPLLIFLDGLDELSESKRVELDNEIQNLQISNNNIRFVIAGRNSSFINLDLLHNSIQLYLVKYFDPNDLELFELMKEYNGTPIADLLTIPTYRNFILENKISKDSKLEEFYNLLVQNNLKSDKKRRDRANNVTPRMISNIEIDLIIKELSEFCFILFKNGEFVFSEKILNNHLKKTEHFIFVINSAIIDFYDEDNISFISNFYFEYFVANALLTKSRNIITQIFFTMGKIKIYYIDILMLFLNCASSKSKYKYDYIKRKIVKDDIAGILLCEFDLLSDSKRFEYLVNIFNEFKKENKSIYYGRFRQVYGPLKNINNMAQRMQQLLPDTYKTKGILFLKFEIMNFLQNPSSEYIISFGNAVILLIPFIKDLWTKKEQAVIKEITIPLIQFFINNNLSKYLDGVLSERFIIDFYEMYNWTANWEQKDWEQLYFDITGSDCNLLSEIVNDYEYGIKFHFFSIFHNDEIIKPLLFPILRYAMRNKLTYGYGMASVVPEMITDDYEMPLVKTDDRIYDLLHILENAELLLTEIIDLLVFSLENKLYQKLKNSDNNVLKILEGKLFDNLCQLENKDYVHFIKYYFNTDEYDFDDRLFKNDKIQEIEALKEYLASEIINMGITKWRTCHFMSKLINFTDAELSHKFLLHIKEKMTENVYKNILYYIFNNKEHILNNYEFVTSEYNKLFENEIIKNTKKEKMLEDVNNQIELINNNDIELMLDSEKMINELHRINDYLLSRKEIDSERSAIGKLLSIKHEGIKHIIKYDNNKEIAPPVFSECAIKIMEGFYRNEILAIDKIITDLQNHSFKKEKFYTYFYWVFILKDKDEIDIKHFIDTYPDLKHNILNSLNKDASNYFINKSLDYFEKYHTSRWLTPFFYYYKTLLDCITPEWLLIEHILKLIVVPDPCRSRGVIIKHDLSINWLLEIFPLLKPCQLIEYGLKNIDNITFRHSRLQIVNYFLNYYNSNEESILTKEILNFIINDTKKMFDMIETDHDYGEFQSIAQFWKQNNENYIDRLFPTFYVNTVTSGIKKNNKGIDYQYRKDVLLYCCRCATIEQKTRIINDIEKDLVNKKLKDNEIDEIHMFLASLGMEKSVKHIIINFYLSGNAIPNRFSYNSYPIGFLTKNSNMLKCFINLFIYSMERNNDRRNILLHIAQDGIKYHITKSSYKLLKKRIIKEIKRNYKQYNWQSEYYREFLLQVEQLVHI